jgi:gliding motility-associated-like protein
VVLSHGADVPFVVNNDSWFSFCAATAGTWQVTFNVGSCALSGLNSGLQMAIFTGTPGALTWLSQAPSPTYSGNTWVSPNITLAAGECAYLMVDGFAGDACGYSYVLTPVGASPCDLVTTCAITANTACTTPGLYTLSGQVTFSNPPATGTMTVTNSCGGSQTFNAPFTSPINYSIPSLTANGANCTVSASFSDTSDCSASVNYTAPASISQPTISTTAPTCSSDGISTITNYNGALTYTFTPAGPSAGAGGLISGMTVGTSYTVTASNGSCSSVASASFSNLAMLVTPAVPTITTTVPTCSVAGTSTITNYNGALTYTFTPAGPSVGAGGLISGMTIGTSYTVTAGNGSCTSVASVSFTNLAILPVPSQPTISTTAPTCSSDGISTITNYNGALTYTFTPAGPSAGAGGLISGMTVGTSYTVTASNGSCSSVASASFSNLAMLVTPAVPTITTTVPTCSVAGTSTITNYNGALTYTFTPAGPSVGAGGLISGMTIGTSYTVTAGNGSCTSVASASFTNLAILPVPSQPTISTTAPTCSSDGISTITNYNGALTYTFTPAGPSAGAGGLISGMTVGTSYTVIASNGSCSSVASASFSNLAMLVTPAVPSITTTVPTCSVAGTSTITNYNGALTYTFTPAGPSVGAGGLISGMTIGTSYTVTAGNGSCTSVASASFTNLAILPVPSQPTISTTAPTCSSDGISTITNYNGALTYTFTPAGPSAGAGGLISGMTVGTSYTVIASNGSCSSVASASFSNLAMLVTPAVPTITTTLPTCSVAGTSTITNYNGALTYTFTPAGPSVGAGGLISGMTIGTSYTVTAGNGSCTSVASASFTNLAILPVPSQPTISTTAPTCLSDGISTITNYNGALTYTFTPAGPSAGAGGLISGMTVGTSYTVTASNGSCSSVASASFSNLAMLVTPAVPTITTTVPTCSVAGTSTITNYNGALTYTFTPAGPSVGAGGLISGMTIGTSYTVTAGNGSCTSVASASFTNLAILPVPSQPTISTTAPTCSSDGISTITNYNGALTYTFTPAGPSAGAGGLISGMTVGTSYTVTASNGSCSSVASASFSNLAMLVTPAVPTITTTVPTCSVAGTSTITNYNGALTYTFTPAGPSVGAGGLISGMTIGTSYTVTAGNGSCTSVASVSFTNLAILPVPSQPTISTTAPTCSSDGISTITNYNGALTYTFTPAGPSAGAGGLISGMTVGTSYTVTASNGSCSSVASASFSNLAMLVTPAVPTITTTVPTCSVAGTSTITNYNGALTYTFTPAGPSVGAGGLISGMTIGTSYTVTAGNGSCTSVASASFTNLAILPVPSQPTISTTAPTCSSDGISTITNYNGALTYTFTPAGPSAGAGGLISGMTVGTSYTVIASNGSCSSVASASFSNLAMLVTPAVPSITTTVPTCSVAGTSTITNYNGALTYTFTPAGPSVGAGGLISGMTIGTSYTVTAGNGSCTSVASASFTNLAILPVPSQPTISTTAPTCSSDGISTITNYNGALTYTFTPAGPSAGAGGLISGMTVGTSYTVTASNGSCSSVASASFSNLAMLASPPTPTVTLVQPTCAVSTGTITITSPLNLLLPSNLFISEVTDEDVGALTYIELFNGTGASVNLSNYKIKVYNNGNAFTSCDITSLSGTLANNSTYVVSIGSVTNQGGVVPNLTVASCAGVNTNDNIRLTSSTDVEIDLWGRIDGVNFTPSNAEGYTYRRLASAVKPSTTWNASDWTSLDPQDYTNVGNYTNVAANYEYSIDGVTYQTNPVFIGVASGTYIVIVRDILTGCTSSISVTIDPLVATLPTPTITSVAATCLANGISTISNYNAGNTYTFTPAGPTVGAGGLISGMTVSTSYTVIAVNGACSSVASTSFSNAAQLPVPSQPTISTTAPTCSSDGISTITNYNGALTYTFTPAGPSAGAGGLISGMTVGTSYIVTASNGSCSSVASASFSNLAMLVTPAVPTITTTVPTCSVAGTSTITNYNGALTYTFTPAGPSVGAGGLISGMTIGTSYTVTAGNGSCTSVASASFTNLAILPVPSQPTISTTAPTCSSDGISTITNYNGALTYTFTPAGPSAGAGGLISGMTVGTSYTVTASNGSCSSTASTSFSNAAMLNTPAIATASVTVQPTCPIPTGTVVVTAPLGGNLEYSIDGGVTYQSSTTFSGLAPDTSYTIIVRDSSSGCTSASSVSIIVDSVPPSPIVSTVSGCNGASFEITASVDLGTATYEWYDSSSNLIGTTATVIVTISGTYEVRATVNSCTTIEFVTVERFACVIPKGVSPNGDGLNDTWDLSGLNAKNVQIFNRYGVEVYSKSNYTDEWEGKTNSGDELPTATYYYVVSLPSGEVKTGWVYINREN